MLTELALTHPCAEVIYWCSGVYQDLGVLAENPHLSDRLSLVVAPGGDGEAGACLPTARPSLRWPRRGPTNLAFAKQLAPLDGTARSGTRQVPAPTEQIADSDAVRRPSGGRTGPPAESTKSSHVQVGCLLEESANGVANHSAHRAEGLVIIDRAALRIKPFL